MSLAAPIRRGRGSAALAAAVLVIALLIASNALVGTLRLPRIDLTAEKLYTLSDGTKSVLADLKEPIDLKLFVSQRLSREIPAYGQYAQRVRDLLGEYVGLSGGLLRLQVLDPQPFTDVEDRAVAYGMQGVPLDQGGEQIYFGLVGTNQADDEERIPFLQPERERFLEYDLTKMVATLANPSKKTLGLISSLPLEGDPFAGPRPGAPEPWAILEQLRQFFDVRSLDPAARTIPADIETVMLVNPDLGPAGQYAIDQFVMRGGRVLAFVDPNAEEAEGRARAMAMRGQAAPPTASDLGPLLAAWGVAYDKSKAVGDRRLARRVSAGGASATRVQAADYIGWLQLPADRMDRDSVVVGQLQRLNLASAGALTQAEGAATEFRPLISSSATSMMVDAASYRGQPDVLGLLRRFESDGQAKTLAARVTGPVKSAFPDGPPEEAKTGEGELPAHLVEAQKPLDAIIVADTDLLADRFWAQTQQFFGERLVVPNAGNADFVINAVDALLGDQRLIALRSRGVSDRPFTYVQEVQQRAETEFRAREQALLDKLKEAERKVGELRRGGEGGQAILTAEQAKAVEGLRGEILATRAELRGVQRSLREDIERLRLSVAAINLAAVPAALILLATLLALIRRARRAQAARAG